MDWQRPHPLVWRMTNLVSLRSPAKDVKEEQATIDTVQTATSTGSVKNKEKLEEAAELCAGATAWHNWQTS